METADFFTFCKNDLQGTSFSAFEEMRRKGKFCDLTIKVQNQPITAHRIIVAAGIPYFQSVFDCAESNSEEKEIEVQDNLDPKALESLILFAYTSKVDITTENVQSLLVTAKFLKLDEISDSCTEFLSERLSIHNVSQARELASSLNISSLIDNCDRYIRQNFEDFSRTQNFLSLPNSCIKGILTKDDLVIASEQVAFEAMMEWVMFSPSERKVALFELLTEVRLIYLPVLYLLKQVDTQELIMDSKPCKDLLNEVKCYHLLPEMVAEFANLKTRPRNCFMQNLYAVCSSRVTESRRLLILIFANQKWLPLSSAETESSLHNVVTVNGKVYMFLDETLQIFDPSNQEWELLKATHEGIKGAATVFHEGKICFGSATVPFRNKMRVFDTQSKKWSKKEEMKTNRWDSAATSLGEFVYVIGGSDNEDDGYTNSVEKYDPPRDLWMDVASMLTKRYGHGCTSMNGKIYVCGGMEMTGCTTALAEVYDPLTNQWKSISSMKNRIVVSLVPHCGRIYACGKTDIEMYDPEDNKWIDCFPLCAYGGSRNCAYFCI